MFRFTLRGIKKRTVPGEAALPAVFFAILCSAAFVIFRVIYPVTKEYAYWMEAGWAGSWSMCPGTAIRSVSVSLFVAAALVVGGVLVPFATVRRLSSHGAFPSRRYTLAVVLSEGAMVVPFAVFAAIYLERPFPWINVLPLAGWWSVGRVTAIVSVLFFAEKTWRKNHPECTTHGRTLAALGVAAAWGMLSMAGYLLFRYQLGEYRDCVCELDGLVSLSLILILLAAVTAAASLCLAVALRAVRKAAYINFK